MSTSFTRSTLSRGDTGTSVLELQRKLGICADGCFGPETELAVREFQAHHGLKVTGEVDQETNEKLFNGSEAEELLRFQEDPD